MILANAARCLKCSNEIYSAHRHDYKECKCGEIFVDGGQEYIRHGYSSIDNYKDLSICISELEFEKCMAALEWADETGRNNLGKICAIFRALRDVGYKTPN